MVEAIFIGNGIFILIHQIFYMRFSLFYMITKSFILYINYSISSFKITPMHQKITKRKTRRRPSCDRIYISVSITSNPIPINCYMTRMFRMFRIRFRYTFTAELLFHLVEKQCERNSNGKLTCVVFLYQ